MIVGIDGGMVISLLALGLVGWTNNEMLLRCCEVGHKKSSVVVPQTSSMDVELWVGKIRQLLTSV